MAKIIITTILLGLEGYKVGRKSDSGKVAKGRQKRPHCGLERLSR